MSERQQFSAVIVSLKSGLVKLIKIISTWFGNYLFSVLHQKIPRWLRKFPKSQGDCHPQLLKILGKSPKLEALNLNFAWTMSKFSFQFISL